MLVLKRNSACEPQVCGCRADVVIATDKEELVARVQEVTGAGNFIQRRSQLMHTQAYECSAPLHALWRQLNWNPPLQRHINHCSPATHNSTGANSQGRRFFVGAPQIRRARMARWMRSEARAFRTCCALSAGQVKCCSMVRTPV